MGDLALLDQLPDRAGNVFDGHAGVDPVLVEQVDPLGSEPAQRSLHRLLEWAVLLLRPSRLPAASQS